MPVYIFDISLVTTNVAFKLLINPPCNFLLRRTNGNNSIKNIIKTIKFEDKKIYSLVGPERGFLNKEKQLINLYKNTISVNLGKNILRTETATISVLSILKILKY